MKTLNLTNKEFEVINKRLELPTISFNSAIPKESNKDDYIVPMSLIKKMEELEWTNMKKQEKTS